MAMRSPRCTPRLVSTLANRCTDSSRYASIVGSFGMGRAYVPFQDPECAQTTGIGQCLGFGDAAAGRERGEIGGRRLLVPDAARLVDQFVDAVGPEEVGLAAVSGR